MPSLHLSTPPQLPRLGEGGLARRLLDEAQEGREVLRRDSRSAGLGRGGPPHESPRVRFTPSFDGFKHLLGWGLGEGLRGGAELGPRGGAVIGLSYEPLNRSTNRKRDRSQVWHGGRALETLWVRDRDEQPQNVEKTRNLLGFTLVGSLSSSRTVEVGDSKCVTIHRQHRG